MWANTGLWLVASNPSVCAWEVSYSKLIKVLTPVTRALSFIPFSLPAPLQDSEWPRLLQTSACDLPPLELESKNSRILRKSILFWFCWCTSFKISPHESRSLGIRDLQVVYLCWSLDWQSDCACNLHQLLCIKVFPPVTDNSRSKLNPSSGNHGYIILLIIRMFWVEANTYSYYKTGKTFNFSFF